MWTIANEMRSANKKRIPLPLKDYQNIENIQIDENVKKRPSSSKKCALKPLDDSSIASLLTSPISAKKDRKTVTPIKLKRRLFPDENLCTPLKIPKTDKNDKQQNVSPININNSDKCNEVRPLKIVLRRHSNTTEVNTPVKKSSNLNLTPEHKNVQSVYETPSSVTQKRRRVSTKHTEEECKIDTPKSMPATPRRSSSRRKSSVNRFSNQLPDEVLYSIPEQGRLTVPVSPKTPTSKNLLRTPKHRVRKLTPSVSQRENSIKTPTTPLDHARQQLHTATAPDSLPCRSREFDTIYRFVARKVNGGSGGCMYISGMPGTGKTATVLRVMKKLEDDSENDEVSKFNFVEINSLRLTEPRQAYCKLWKQLSGDTLTVDQAYRLLEKKFTKPNRNASATVILIDELDYLCNKRQDVIYSLLEWTTVPRSQLVVLTIANTMDLPERTLKGRVTSRMGLTRLVFQPYTYQQLQQIVQDRLSGNESFHPDAIQLVARKVAAISGDARRALDICRLAVDVACDHNTDETDSIVAIAHIEAAIKQILSSPIISAIKNCSVMEQLLLRAVRDEAMRTGIEGNPLDKVYIQFQALCTLEGISVPYIGDVYFVAANLIESGFIMVEPGRHGNRKVFLNISSDDIHYALS